MIVVQLKGGLGNQMFQYAIGRSLSIKLETNLYLDLSHLLDKDFWEKYIYREYELGIFNLQVNTNGDKKKRRFFPESYFNKVRLLKEKWYQLKNFKVVHEEFIVKDKFLDYITRNTYLIGYWQSEFYFKENASTLINDFKFKTTLSKNDKISQQIGSSNSISVHIRRGDYVSNEQTFKLHGICSLDYYRKAIEHISMFEVDPEFFFFSDEPEWVLENLSIPYKSTVISWNKGKESFEDMRLMSLCKHNIIANSSFSWWGAWLNSRPNKRVIAPKQWFADESKNDAANFLIPEEWIRI